MTLIAAFRSSSGIALCADSQETVTMPDGSEFRATVQKISPIIEGKYQIAIAGSGNAKLIEAFIVRARRALNDQDSLVCTMENPAGVKAIHQRMEDELKSFYERDVRLYPNPDKDFRLFIAACCPIAQQYALWVSEGIVLREVRSPELIGWEHELYSETAKRLASDAMSMTQAILASVYTLTIAINTSNYIRNPLSVATIDGTGTVWRTMPTSRNSKSS